MRVLIAPDKFKDCLSAQEVARHLASGAEAAGAEVDICPLADGGEGTVRAMVSAMGGTLHRKRVVGPLPDMTVEAEFGIIDKLAVIEMAAASGLAMLKADDRNPMNTTTFGTGQLLLAAVEMGVERIILGIGGSATCDAGLGCCQAVGHTVLMKSGEPVSQNDPLCGRDLADVMMIKRGRGSVMDRVPITVACDVDNPLYGERGAARVFAPQKGASAEDVKWLDEQLRTLAMRCHADDVAQQPGAGAAGGLGFAMLAFFNAELKRGIEIVMEAVNFRERVALADLVITGEGRFDRSSLAGKTTVGVARICREMNKPCVLVAGAIDDEVDAHSAGFSKWRSLSYIAGVQTAMQQTAELLELAARETVSILKPPH